MSIPDKPTEVHPLYGPWINGVMTRLLDDIKTARQEAEGGLSGGTLDPTHRAEVKQALEKLNAAERALQPRG